MTYYLTFVTLTSVTWPWALRPDAPLLNTNISCKFRENRMMGKGQKGCDGQTAGRPAGRTDGQDSSYICQVADKNYTRDIVNNKYWLPKTLIICNQRLEMNVQLLNYCDIYDLMFYLKCQTTVSDDFLFLFWQNHCSKALCEM